MIWSGLYTALITPCLGNTVDLDGLHTLISLQNHYADGIVILGSTGEAFSLTREEHRSILSLCYQCCTVPYIVGCSATSITEALSHIRLAETYHAHAIMLAPPPYIRPNEASLLYYLRTLASSTSLPVILYNIPTRTHVEISFATITTLLQEGLCIGIKETQKQRIPELINLKQQYPFALFAGNDSDIPFIMQQGGDGAISVLSNLLPEALSLVVQGAPIPDYMEILLQGMTVDTNPIPIKAVMNLVGLPAGPPKLPLLPLEQQKYTYFQQGVALWKKSLLVS